MCIHLPCGYSSQTLTEKIATFEIILGLICTLGFGSAGIYLLIVHPHGFHECKNVRLIKDGCNSELYKFLRLNLHVQLVSIFLIVLYFICGIALGFLLLTAAQLRNLRKLKIWMYLQFVWCAMRFLILMFIINFISQTRRVDLVLICILISMYGGFLVLSVRIFIEEVRIENICCRNNSNTNNNHNTLVLP